MRRPTRAPDRRAVRPPASATGDPFSAALALLTRRDFTIHELTERLTTRGFAPEAVALAVDRLVASGTLDDRRVGAAHVRTSSRVKRRGTIRIRMELQARGLAPALVRELLSSLPAEDERATLADAIRRMRLPQPLDSAARRRAFARLLRRGFSADAIAKALGPLHDLD